MSECIDQWHFAVQLAASCVGCLHFDTVIVPMATYLVPNPSTPQSTNYDESAKTRAKSCDVGFGRTYDGSSVLNTYR